jgi:hypothetical protein
MCVDDGSEPGPSEPPVPHAIRPPSVHTVTPPPFLDSFLDCLLPRSATCVASCSDACWRLGKWWSRRVGEEQRGVHVAAAVAHLVDGTHSIN